MCAECKLFVTHLEHWEFLAYIHTYIPSHACLHTFLLKQESCLDYDTAGNMTCVLWPNYQLHN